ncbi:MAG: glycosyl hydrolase family 28 protein [Acidobacteriota bacterium]
MHPHAALPRTAMPTTSRRRFLATLAATPLLSPTLHALVPPWRADITAFGAIGDGKTLNTKTIQAAIDKTATMQVGIVVGPRGTFVTGALFFKPGVSLHLSEGAVLQASTDLTNFPVQPTRVEGHSVQFNPALINASHCDGFSITGSGTLDGAGRPVWDLFWKLRNAAPDPHNFPNLGLPRARMAFIEHSRNVSIDGITFKDSQFWNLHLYNCDGVTVRNTRFVVPDDYHQAPSTDGIDIDSSRNVTVDGCFFSVTDDCIAAKGSKGPHATEDHDSPPVEHIRIRNCTYKRGGGVFTIGSEATLVRDVVIEDCTIVGHVRIATLKLRPDTPQHYEDITFRNITSTATAGPIISVQPWTQYFDLKGEAPPKSIVRNVQLIGIKGHYSAFGILRPNPGQTTITGVTFKDINAQLDDPKLDTKDTTDLRFDNVIVNGKPQSA